MNRLYHVTLCILASFLLVVGLKGPAAGQLLAIEQVKQDVAVLTADSLLGRGYVPDGASRAARYIRERYREIGLSAPDSGFFQSFPLTVDVITEVPTLVLNGDSLAPGKDFVPHRITGGGMLEEAEHIVSVGSGLVIPRREIDTYPQKDVRESVVVLQEAVPDSIRSDSMLSARDWSLPVRVEQAAERGADAVLIPTDRLIYSIHPYDAPVPVLSVGRQAWPDSLTSVSLDIPVSADQSLRSQNVIGVIEGTTYPDSMVVLTAHYDHVGSWGEMVYFPGANDNASGTALLLALARQFREEPLPYTVVCIAFSGEEHGLLGSRYLAENPPFDLSKVRFLLNFDMVASGGDGIMAVGGTDFPEEFQRLAAVSDSLNLGPLGKRRNAPNSDHYPLVEKGISGFFLYSRGGSQPYHHVDDRMETLDWNTFENVYALAVHFLKSL